MEARVFAWNVNLNTARTIETLVYKEYGIEVISKLTPIGWRYDVVGYGIDDKQFAAIYTFTSGIVQALKFIGIEK